MYERRVPAVGVVLMAFWLGASACGGDSGGRSAKPGSGGGGGSAAGGKDGRAVTDASDDANGGATDTARDATTGASDVASSADVSAGETPAGDSASGDSASGDSASIECVPGAGTQLIGNASVLDRRTCLLWQRAATTALMTNKQAARYCDGLLEDGFADWRVPAPEELVTWPNLAANDNAYITNPTYIPTASAAVADGCMADSHSCNISEYNTGAIACAWQGVGFAGPTVCVRGAAVSGTTVAAFAAAHCAACQANVAGAGAAFKVADCLPYAP